MKVSIITPTLNCENTLPITLSSVLSQNYKKIEHIIVDGGSSDSTLKILKKYTFRKKKIFFFKKKKLYESINFGIKQCTGDLIAILNSDDLYNNNNIIADVVKIAKKQKCGIYIGNCVYFSNKNFKKIVRNYNIDFFSPDKLSEGLMPAHTASFIKKEIYHDVGYYDEKMDIAADFDFFLRSIFLRKKNYYKMNMVITRMKTGGISNKGLISYLKSTKEIALSFKKNKIKTNIFKILLRIPMKLRQFFFIDNLELNKNFKLMVKKNYINYFHDFKIIQNPRNINFKKNFILSAMNLAFLGNYYANNIKFNADFIHWPDGIYSKTLQLNNNIKKIPGRTLLRRIKIPSYIKKIIILGNLGFRGNKYLKTLYNNKKIYNEKLQYGSASKIFENIKYKKFKKSDLIFLTLPTPKQEVLADLISRQNKFFKIICIGGSIAIASGEEKEVPKIFYEFEWIWRLRYETLRRIQRLLVTFFSYQLVRIFTKKYDNLTVKLID